MDVIPEVLKAVKMDLEINLTAENENYVSVLEFYKSCESIAEQRVLLRLTELFPGQWAEWNGTQILSSDFCSPHYLGFDLRIYPKRKFEMNVYNIHSDKEKLSQRIDFLLSVTRWDHSRGKVDNIVNVAVQVDCSDTAEVESRISESEDGYTILVQRIRVIA